MIHFDPENSVYFRVDRQFGNNYLVRGYSEGEFINFAAHFKKVNNILYIMCEMMDFESFCKLSETSYGIKSLENQFSKKPIELIKEAILIADRKVKLEKLLKNVQN